MSSEPCTCPQYSQGGEPAPGRRSSGSSSTSPASARSTRRSTWRPWTSRCGTRACSAKRYGHVLDYMARVELEVDRNVLELITMLPDPPPVDRTFYADVWQPQEIRHGQILDELQVRLGRDNARRRPRPRLGQDPDPRRGRAPRPDPGRRPDALLPDRHGDRAVGGAGLQPAPRGRHRARRDGRRRHDRGPDPPPGAGPLRVLQDVRARPGRAARRLAEVAGPAHAADLLRAGRRQQRRAEGRLRRPRHAARHRPEPRVVRHPDLPGRARAALGAGPRDADPRLRPERLPRGRRAGPGRPARPADAA